MAHYYNLVTNASGTFTFEEVQRICSVDGQQVQLVVEDVNNGGNGSQQFVTYTAATQNNEQAIFPPQTINLGNQITATRLEQGQNVFIIKTNDIATTQEISKANIANARVVNENIINITNSTGTKTECNSENHQIQWIKMQNPSSTATKQSALLQEKNQTAIVTKTHIQNNIASSSTLYVNSELLNSGKTEKKSSRSYQNKSRHMSNNVQRSTASQVAYVINAKPSTENRIQSSNASNPKLTSSFCGKTVGALGQNVTVRLPRASNSNVSQIRPTVPLEMSKTPLRVQPPDMEHLSEQIKQAKLKQMQSQRHLQSDQQRIQQNNVQRQLVNTIQLPGQPPLSNSIRRSITPNPTQKSQQTSSPTQSQELQKTPLVTPPHSPAVHNMHNAMDIDTSEHVQEKIHLSQEPSPPQSEPESNSSESIAYLQKTISDPANAIVQQQIQGNTAKMLVMLATGEQRLITFDIPSEDCTVHDLLDQVNITFCGDTSVSLVVDEKLGINYIVEAGSGTYITSCESSEYGSDFCNLSQETVNSNSNSESLMQSTNASDENSNPSLPSNEEPILVKGMLALCPHCGYSSLYFNRCERCNTKLSEEVKSIPIEERKDTGLSVDTFYKKNNERNSKLEKTDRDSSSCKRPRVRGKGAASKPKPINKEPECLTISSDDEEDGKTRKVAGTNNVTTLANANNAFNEDIGTILEKEPIITNTSVFNSCDDFVTDKEDSSKGICDDESVIDNGQLPHTAIECRTVRIGSYKYIPREDVLITPNGVRFGVPLLEDDKNFVTLDVKFKDIIKVLIHFGKTMPVLFFYTSTSTGAMIRELLGMQDPKGPYYDPAGKDHTHKRITLLPEKLTEDSKAKLKSLFSPKGKMAELSPKEANDILLRASPMDNLPIFNITRRSSLNSVQNTVSINDSIQTITVYPPPPAKGGIAINTEDYLCLAEDQFLNDVIIDFYLKYLTLEVLSESDQQRTHVFSSYFYKRLTSPHAQAAENTVPMTPAAKRHARVQKWTKNVNIFEKDFIIIPINEHAHWFLAIICFPKLVGKISMNTTKSNDSDVNKTVHKTKLQEVKAKAVTIGCTTITPVTTTIMIDQSDDGSERDEAEGDDEEMEADSEEEDDNEQLEESKHKHVKVEQNTSQQEGTVRVPCILIFDSLAGASRARVVATLRDYLSCEHVAKLGVEKTFSKDTIKGACPKVPQQSNFTDCGLYVLQYVESFFKDSIKNYTLPIKTLKTWFEEIVVTRKREELSKLLIRLMNSTKGDRIITLPTVNFPTQDGKLKPKSENHVDVKVTKPESENKRKSVQDADTRISVSVVAENTETTNDLVSRTTYQIIPYSPCTSANSNESNSPDMLTESKTPRSSSETMSYLKSKRIPRLMSRTQNQEDSQIAKRHKGESSNSCK